MDNHKPLGKSPVIGGPLDEAHLETPTTMESRRYTLKGPMWKQEHVYWFEDLAWRYRGPQRKKRKKQDKKQ